jgi:Flp pilus assembly protein TadG
MSHAHPGSRRRSESGQVFASFSLIALPVAIAALGLAVETGQLVEARSRAQLQADAAALAAARALSTKDETVIAERAAEIVTANQSGPHSTTSGADQPGVTVEFGTWSEQDGTFTPVAQGNVAAANAVRVQRTQPTPSVLAWIWNRSFTVSADSIARGAPPSCGMWGISEVNIGGAYDSYSLAAGYDPLSAKDNANICSCGEIGISGTVFGNARPGPGHSVTGSGLVTGSTEPLNSCDPPSLPDFSDVAVNNDNATLPPVTVKGFPSINGKGELDIGNGDNLTLQPGRYYFPAVGVGGSLTVTGPTELWVVGDVVVSGKGLVNTTENPEYLTVISSGTNVTLGGQAELYGSVLAPSALVKYQGNTEAYGITVANELNAVGHGKYHIAEELMPKGLGGGKMALVR